VFVSCSEPVRAADGTLLYWIGVNLDIEELRQAEFYLRRSEAYLAEAQRLSHTGNFGWKPATGEIVWSDESYRIFECDRSVKPTIAIAQDAKTPYPNIAPIEQPAQSAVSGYQSGQAAAEYS
jgi:PAS domain-containing protein